MVRLRLRRTGTRNKACFRIVAADQRSPRDGRFIEVIGYYDPRHQDEKIDLERAEHWLSQGAQATGTVTDIIARARSGKTLAKPAKPAPPKPAPTPKEEPAEAEEPVVEAVAEAAETPAAAEEAPEETTASAPAEAEAEAKTE